jgi:hypothetical protein
MQTSHNSFSLVFQEYKESKDFKIKDSYMPSMYYFASAKLDHVKKLSQ